MFIINMILIFGLHQYLYSTAVFLYMFLHYWKNWVWQTGNPKKTVLSKMNMSSQKSKLTYVYPSVTDSF